jgi:opacity protein-like surface antigen
MLVSAPAGAVEHEHSIGLGEGMAVLKVDDKSTLSTGGATTLHYTYGINDQFNLMAEASWALVALHQEQDNPDSPHTRPATVSTVNIGVGYVIDIIRFVPYIGLLGTGVVMNGGTLEKARYMAGASLAAGLDYKFNRSWSAGVAYRQQEFLTEASTYPSYSVFTLRAQYVWGF